CGRPGELRRAARPGVDDAGRGPGGGHPALLEVRRQGPRRGPARRGPRGGTDGGGEGHRLRGLTGSAGGGDGRAGTRPVRPYYRTVAWHDVSLRIEPTCCR